MESDRPVVSRRSLLATLPTLGLAGCGRLAGASNSSAAVRLLAAGSLNDALENHLRQRVDAPLQVEAHGSVQVTRLVANGQKDPDIVAVADDTLFESILTPAWYATLATNEIVLGYNDDTDGGRALATAGNDDWFRVLLEGDVALGRTDPALDPLGYRTLFALELATRYYGTDADLRDAITAPDQRYPETQLLGQFETGAIDAAFMYRSMAVDRDYDYISLPAAVNLGDPAHTDEYATVSYTLDDGREVTGDLIRYAATIRHSRPTVERVFEALLTSDALTDAGFTVPDDYPSFTPHAPDEYAH